MPVLESERQTTPRSALRYRPTHTDQARPTLVVSQVRRSRPPTQTTTRPVSEDEQDQGEEEPLSRHKNTLTAPRKLTRRRTRRRFHPLFWVGLGLLTIMLLWTGISQLLAWGDNEWNNLRYGYPRTFQIDAVIGNGDSQTHPSHLLALNLSGEIILEVFPAGDASHAKDYILTTLAGPSSDLTPVTLRLIDPLHTGKPDLVVTVGSIQSIMMNDQGSFRSPTPAEQQQLLPYLS